MRRRDEDRRRPDAPRDFRAHHATFRGFGLGPRTWLARLPTRGLAAPADAAQGGPREGAPRRTLCALSGRPARPHPDDRLARNLRRILARTLRESREAVEG